MVRSKCVVIVMDWVENSRVIGVCSCSKGRVLTNARRVIDSKMICRAVIFDRMVCDCFA